jgi:hypothetical protein
VTTSYQTRIRADCRCTAEEAPCVEHVMRDFVLHSTLDWLNAVQFRTAARKAHRLYKAEKALFDHYFAGIRDQFHKDSPAHV